MMQKSCLSVMQCFFLLPGIAVIAISGNRLSPRAVRNHGVPPTYDRGNGS